MMFIFYGTHENYGCKLSICHAVVDINSMSPLKSVHHHLRECMCVFIEKNQPIVHVVSNIEK